jgi:hypothetical protein
MFIHLAVAMDMHDRCGLAGANHFFQWAVLAILAAGMVYAMGNAVTALADNLVTGYMVMVTVFLVGSDDLEMTVNNHEGIGIEVHNRFAAGLVGLSGHAGFRRCSCVMSFHDNMRCPAAKVKSCCNENPLCINRVQLKSA